jgi:hypothetical protein
MERKQAFMFRAVDIAMELFVMVATIIRTKRLIDSRAPSAKSAVELSDLYCRNARHFIEARFGELWNNDDDLKYAVGRHVLEERFGWMEHKAAATATSPASDAAAAK